MGDDRSIALLEEIRDLLQRSVTNQEQLLRSNAEAMGLYRTALQRQRFAMVLAVVLLVALYVIATYAW